ncbi:MAG: hypothetical protein ABIK54_07680, partial [candidate division WOR-3 bacterium]
CFVENGFRSGASLAVNKNKFRRSGFPADHNADLDINRNSFVGSLNRAVGSREDESDKAGRGLSFA